MSSTKNNNILFYIGYAFIVISFMLHRVLYISNILNVISNIGFIILFINIITSIKKFDRKTIMLMIIMIIISTLSYYYSKDLAMLKLTFIILAASKIEFNEFIQKDFKFKLLLVLLVVGLHFLGLTSDYNLVRSDGSIRNSMGFSHPNMFGYQLMILCLEYLYIRYIKNKNNIIYDSLIIVSTVLIINFCSDSRSSIFILIIFLLLYLFKNLIFKRLQKQKLLQKIFKYSFIIIGLITVVLTINYSADNLLISRFDSLLSYRLSYGNYFYNTYHFSWFGQVIITISNEVARLKNISPLVLDNLYLVLLIKYGILSFCIVAYLFTSTFKKLICNKNFYLILIFVSLAIFSFMESTLIIIEISPFIIYFSSTLFEKNNKLKEDVK